MLDRAQEAIGLGQLPVRCGRDPAALLEARQRGERVGDAQLRLAAAGDQLLGLHEELDLADAAAADLDVVAGHGDGAEAVEGVDLPLHGVDVGDGREIQIFAPDVGRQLAKDGGARGDVAGHRAGLDEGGALPVLAEALVVVERSLGGDRERRGAGIGPQAQIGAEHIAVAGALREQAHEIAREAHEERLHLEAGAQADAGEVVEDDEVDVGGVVELEGTVLAHAQHDVAVGAVAQPIAGLGGLAEEEGDGGRDGSVGGLGEAARDGHHRPHAAEVAQRGEQGDVGLEEAQRAHGIGESVGCANGSGNLMAQRGEALLGRCESVASRLAGRRSIRLAR